jgi:putative FmdB family regulatory protein
VPIYEYVCDDCGTRYERLVLNKAQEISCPKCESSKHTLQLSVFSAPGNSSKADGQSSSLGAGACGCTPRGCGCH